MVVDILTIFPEMCRVPLGESIMGRAQESGLLTLRVHDLRDYTKDKHRKVDDEPYGGGQGMVMMPEPFFAAVEHLKSDCSRVVLMTPQGRRLEQSLVVEFVSDEHLIVLCGHYEGVDHRVVEGLVDQEISIGDYVLSNGAIAAAVFIDAVVRQIPGVLGDERSAAEDTFSDGLLEAPCYTRPPEFRGMRVPEVLTTGNHAKMDEWKRRRSLERTKENRPDLMT